ncbi:uncharacterized protein L201_007391 [Kwoniella dendrophila CBS 6074]|uniref:Uncharacterized protein n=1 Tax=Kwoniella dendrophila CBS 6074 TaxID=1295534 RepID=A0AAX4K5S5_9TREE
MSMTFPQTPNSPYRRISSDHNHGILSPSSSPMPITPKSGTGPLPHIKSPLSECMCGSQSQSQSDSYFPPQQTSPYPSISSNIPHSPKPHNQPLSRPSPHPLQSSPLPSSKFKRPSLGPRSQSMMYNPYQQQWPGMMQGSQIPQMQMGGSQIGSAAMSVHSGAGSNATENLKPFDSSKMKQGRMGHYGYLDGRELAGPPPGYMPAGVQADQYQPPSSGNRVSPSHRGGSTSGQSYYQSSPSQAGSVDSRGDNGSMGWGDVGNTARARYDGSSSVHGYVQADLDTPYPRTAGGGASSAFTRYGPDGSVANGIDGRLGINHRRLRSGVV